MIPTQSLSQRVVIRHFCSNAASRGKPRSVWAFLKQEFQNAWQELLQEAKIVTPSVSALATSQTSKWILPVEPKQQGLGGSNSTDKPPAFQYRRGPSVYIPRSESLNAWERMQRRLRHAPIVDFVCQSKDASLLRWGSTGNGTALREFHVSDPNFTVDDWSHKMTQEHLPVIMQWILHGKLDLLHDWLSDDVFAKVAAEVTARQQEGIQMNDCRVIRLLDPVWWDVWGLQPQTEKWPSPIIVLHFICDQTYCVRHSGEIVEGSDDTIKSFSYVAAFVREEDLEGNVRWKIVDLRFNGPIHRYQQVREVKDSPDYRPDKTE